MLPENVIILKSIESDGEGYGRMKLSRFTEEQMEGSKSR